MEGREISEERFLECMAMDFPNFKITKSNLTHPTSQFVISFYALILRHVIEVKETEEIWNLTEDQRPYIRQNPEAATFSQHVWTNNLYRTVKYVFSRLSENGTEFVYSDILFPEITPRRSFVFMALMLNFYWYTNDFAVGLNDDMATCINEGMQIRNLQIERDKLINQVTKLEDQKSQYAEMIKEIRNFIKKCMESNEEKEIVMKDLIEEEEAIMKMVEEVAEEEQSLQEVDTKLQNEEKYLESLIVSNQNQVIDVHQKTLNRKEECVKNMKDLEERVKQASNKLASRKEVLEHQEKLKFCLKEEKFVPESQGSQKGFEGLVKSINTLKEKNKKLLENDLILTGKISEGDEVVAKLNNACQHFESEQQKICAKGKDRTTAYMNNIDSQKKTYSQLFVQMRKDADEVEGLELTSLQLSSKCDKTEEKSNNLGGENKEKYLNCAKEMKEALNSLQVLLGDDRGLF